MRTRRAAVQVLVPVLAIELLWVPDAQAYLDPGSLGFTFQVVAAAILGALITLKLQWRKVKTGVRSFFSRKKEERA